MTTKKAKSKAKKSELKKNLSSKKKINNNLIKIKATKNFLLRDWTVSLAGQIISTDKKYADVLQKEVWFEIIQ